MPATTWSSHLLSKNISIKSCSIYPWYFTFKEEHRLRVFRLRLLGWDWVRGSNRTGKSVQWGASWLIKSGRWDGGVCGVHLQERCQLEDEGIDGSIILKYTQSHRICMDWINVIQGRYKWQACMNTIMNLQVP